MGASVTRAESQRALREVTAAGPLCLLQHALISHYNISMALKSPALYELWSQQQACIDARTHRLLLIHISSERATKVLPWPSNASLQS